MGNTFGSLVYSLVMMTVVFGLFFWTKRRTRQKAKALGVSAADMQDASLWTPPETASKEFLAALEASDAALARQAAQQNVSTLAQVVYALREGRWDERYFYVDTFAPLLSRGVAEMWVRNERNSAIAYLFRGKQAVAWAWQARGKGMASEVSAEAFRMFSERLAWALMDFERAARMDPADPTPWILMMDAIDGRDVLQRAGKYLEEARCRYPESFAASSRMIALLGPRWYGDAGQVLKFAREVAAQAREGSELPMLLLRAYFEVWFHLERFENKPAEAEAYRKQPIVRQELRTAYGRSLGSPAHIPSKQTLALRNWAVLTFFHTGDIDLLQREARNIAGRFTEFPWLYFGDSLRKQAMQAAGV